MWTKLQCDKSKSYLLDYLSDLHCESGSQPLRRFMMETLRVMTRCMMGIHVIRGKLDLKLLPWLIEVIGEVASPLQLRRWFEKCTLLWMLSLMYELILILCSTLELSCSLRDAKHSEIKSQGLWLFVTHTTINYYHSVFFKGQGIILEHSVFVWIFHAARPIRFRVISTVSENPTLMVLTEQT